ncbi:MAG TPA: four helix bundle protein [Terriglobia bacterium]|nr:four helix bundle protein [Terriglobia bacterium]
MGNRGADGISERILDYGARIIKVVEALPNTLVGRRIADQVLRSGLSVAANFEEAQAAESTADFAHKLQIALKEAREAKYWLRVVSKAEKLPQRRLELLVDESDQLVAMLSKAVAKAKGKAKPRETAPVEDAAKGEEGGKR